MALVFRYRTGMNNETIAKEHMWDMCHRYNLHFRTMCAMFRIQRKAYILSSRFHEDYTYGSNGLALDRLLHEMIIFARHGAIDVRALLKVFDDFPTLHNFDKTEFMDAVYTYSNHKSIIKYARRVKRLFIQRGGR